MERKILSVIIAFGLFFGSVSAQNQEAGDSLVRELKEIVVTANQSATKLVGSTLVSTIPGSNLVDLGTALDVLAQLPMIKVADNSVSVIGKSNVEIYIDGRPMRDEAELQQMLSSNMQKVELLMAPGAEYESTTGAVLKITTRRNFRQGLSVTDRFQLQRRRRWSAMDYLALSYTSRNWEFFIDGSVNHDNSVIKGSTINRLNYENVASEIGSSQRNAYPTTVGIVKAGLNFARGSQSFGAYWRYNPERGEFSNKGTEWIDGNPPLAREIDKHIKAHSHLVSAYYENTFADKFLLHFDGDFRRSNASNCVSTIYPAMESSDVNSTDRRTSTLLAGKLYLKFPLWSGDFSAGTQESYTRTLLDYRMLNAEVGEYIPSVVTDGRQISAALFASWSRQVGRLSLSVGARYEFVDYAFNVDGTRDSEVSRRDHLLTPDLSIGYMFNDDAQVSLSYKMSTVKPPYSQLTGSLTYVGQHEIEGGNQTLRDERMNDVQLFGMWKGFMLQADYVRARDSYAYVKRLYPADNLQLLMQPVNINLSALSLYLVWSKSVGVWTPNLTLGMYRQWLRLDGERHDRPIFSYYFDNTFSFARGWTLTANVSGNSSGDMHTNRFGATLLTMDASVGKSFFNKSLTLKLTATDIFNSANNDWTMNTYGIAVSKRQSYDRRGLSLSLIYTFQSRKTLYKGAAASPAELNRL